MDNGGLYNDGSVVKVGQTSSIRKQTVQRKFDEGATEMKRVRKWLRQQILLSLSKECPRSRLSLIETAGLIRSSSSM